MPVIRDYGDRYITIVDAHEPITPYLLGLDKEPGPNDTVVCPRVFAPGAQRALLSKGQKTTEVLPTPSELKEGKVTPSIAPKIEENDEQFVMPSVDASLVKSPVALLQELCAKRGAVPIYSFIAEDTKARVAYYRAKVEVFEKVAGGVGTSKKKAKGIAADAMLKQLAMCVEVPEEAPVAHGAVVALVAQGAVVAPVAQGAVVAPIVAAAVPAPPPKESQPPLQLGLLPAGASDGECLTEEAPMVALIKYCQALKLERPLFNFKGDTGAQPKMFAFECQVNGEMTAACGSSKRSAKHGAATQMLELLRKRQAEIKRPVNVRKLEDVASVIRFHKKLPKDGLFVEQVAKLDLTGGGGECDYVQLLMHFANEMLFAVDFFDLSDAGGEALCAIRLATMPGTMIIKNGDSFEEAMVEAAKESLRFCKNLIKATRWNSGKGAQ